MAVRGLMTLFTTSFSNCNTHSSSRLTFLHARCGAAWSWSWRYWSRELGERDMRTGPRTKSAGEAWTLLNGPVENTPCIVTRARKLGWPRGKREEAYVSPCGGHSLLIPF